MINNLSGLMGLAGKEIPVSDLRELNKALRAQTQSVMKGSVGTVQQGVGFSSVAGSEIAPLVPQSIQSTLDSATFTQSAIQFWKMLSKVNVSSTLHEATRVNEHGSMGMDPFFAEGSVPGISEAEYERQVVQIKFLAEYIELTDVATMVGVVGPNRTALAQRTQDGTSALLGKLERALFNADSALSTLHFDGLHKQITTGAPNNVTDKRGAGITPQGLQELLGNLMSDPNFARANAILVDPRQYQSLSNIATAHGRHDQIRASGQAVSFGHKQLFVGGPQGDVPVIPCPLMRQTNTPNAAALGNNPPNAGAMPSTAYANPGATSGSQFVAADAGTYYYKVVGIGDEGVTAPSTSAVQTVAAGEAITITISDGTGASGLHSGIRYYRVFRSAKNAADASNVTFLGEFAANDVGGSDETVITDLNAKIPGTAPVYILQNTPDVMYWAQLLDFTRRPIAQTTTTIPFLLMLFGSLFVKVPTKNWVIDNVALTF
jgi:hypothetical protein